MARGGSCCGQSRDVDQTPLVIQRGAAGVRSDGSAGNQASRAPAPPPPRPRMHAKTGSEDLALLLEMDSKRNVSDLNR